jgi:hypothetical protein
VCSGYVRWLIADEARVGRAQNNPEAARREFWRAESAEDRQGPNGERRDDEIPTPPTNSANELRQTPASFLAVPGENVTVSELQARRDQGQNAVKAVKAVKLSGEIEGESDPDDSAGGLGGHLRGIRDRKRAAKEAGHG